MGFALRRGGWKLGIKEHHEKRRFYKGVHNQGYLCGQVS
jgi:hypothetical protein